MAGEFKFFLDLAPPLAEDDKVARGSTRNFSAFNLSLLGNF